MGTKESRVAPRDDKPGYRSVTVTWGPMAFTPVSYSSLHVGPFTAEVTLPEGASDEDVQVAMDRALKVITMKGHAEYESQLTWFLAALKHGAKQARE